MRTFERKRWAAAAGVALSLGALAACSSSHANAAPKNPAVSASHEATPPPDDVNARMQKLAGVIIRDYQSQNDGRLRFGPDRPNYTIADIEDFSGQYVLVREQSAKAPTGGVPDVGSVNSIDVAIIPTPDFNAPTGTEIEFTKKNDGSWVASSSQNGTPLQKIPYDSAADPQGFDRLLGDATLTVGGSPTLSMITSFM